MTESNESQTESKVDVGAVTTPTPEDRVHWGERWRPVVGYEDTYEVSDCGRVRSLGRVQIRVQHEGLRMCTVPTKILRFYDSHRDGKSGKRRVTLTVDGYRRTVTVHKLVLEAFVGPCPPGLECCHNDGNFRNNHVTNLRWDTRKSNAQDLLRHRAEGRCA